MGCDGLARDGFGFIFPLAAYKVIMLNHEIKSMRSTIAGMLLRKVPPTSVSIKAEHAAYLGFDVKPESLEALDERSADGHKKASVFRVKVEDLYVQLKGAKGSDDDNPTGQVRIQGRANTTTVAGGGPRAEETGQAGDQDQDSGAGNQPPANDQESTTRSE